MDEVEKLLKRHAAFEKSAATWEERFSALERLTAVRRRQKPTARVPLKLASRGARVEPLKKHQHPFPKLPANPRQSCRSLTRHTGSVTKANSLIANRRSAHLVALICQLLILHLMTKSASPFYFVHINKKNKINPHWLYLP